MFTPAVREWHPFMIGTQHYYAALLHPMGGATNSVSAVWPSANLALYLPLYVRVTSTVNSIWWINGATASGNVDMGIYSEGGFRLYHTGSTAQSGTNVPQTVTITSGLDLTPARYWLGLAMDNGTGTIFRWTNSAALVGIQRFAGMQQQASAFVLPATTTFAQAANAFIPHMGLDLTVNAA